VAIDHLEKTGVRLLGWEALLSSRHGESPYRLLQGSGDLSGLDKATAADVTRSQIEASLKDPYYTSDEPTAELYFVITVDAV